MVFNDVNEACEWIDDVHANIDNFSNENHLWYAVIFNCDVLYGGSIEVNKIFMSRAYELEDFIKHKVEELNDFKDISPYAIYSNALKFPIFGGNLYETLKQINTAKKIDSNYGLKYE